MSKVFTRNEFIEKLKWLVNDVPNYYYSGNGTWCNYNWDREKFMMDCVVSIKGLLWGFVADKYKSHGGGVLGANGVADFRANDMTYCTEVSSDFSKIQPGEYMSMAGTQYSHAGVCLESATPSKRGKAFECTTGWGVNRCVISEFDIYGNRYYNGVKNVAKWTKFGKLIYIDYSDTPTPPTPPTPTYTGTITYQAFVGEWLPAVNKADYTNDGYAGIWGNAISGFRCKPQYGEINYQAHIKGGDWLPVVNSKDYSTGGDNSYAGIYGKPIDCIKIKSTLGWVKYRVHVKGGSWLPWVMSTTETGTESYAGIYGKEIDGIQMY